MIERINQLDDRLPKKQSAVRRQLVTDWAIVSDLIDWFRKLHTKRDTPHGLKPSGFQGAIHDSLPARELGVLVRQG